MSISVLQLLIVLCVPAAGRGEDWLRQCVHESGVTAQQTHTVNLMLFWILALTSLIVRRDFSFTSLAKKYSTFSVMRLLRFQVPV